MTPDFDVVGMNTYAKNVLGGNAVELGKSVFAYHPRKSHGKLEEILDRSKGHEMTRPIVMVIDVLGKALMINVCRVDSGEAKGEHLYAMTFIDVTEQTGAEVNPLSGKVELSKFPISNKGSYSFIDPNSIYYIHSDGNYCIVRTQEKQDHVHLTLKSILTRYTGKLFFQVHKSYIVNLNYVDKLEKTGDGQTVITFDSPGMDSIPVAKRRVKELKKAMAAM